MFQVGTLELRGNFLALANILRQFILVFYYVLEFRRDKSTVTVSIALATLVFGIVFRMILFRTIESDRVLYRWYTALYNLQLVAACISLRGLSLG